MEDSFKESVRGGMLSREIWDFTPSEIDSDTSMQILIVFKSNWGNFGEETGMFREEIPPLSLVG